MCLHAVNTSFYSIAAELRMSNRRFLTEASTQPIKSTKAQHRRAESGVQYHSELRPPLTSKYLSSDHASQSHTPDDHSPKYRINTHSSLNNTCISLPTVPDSPVTTKASSRSFVRTLSNLTDMMEETQGKVADAVGYRRAISLLDAEVIRLKKESQSKSRQIDSLSSRLQSYVGKVSPRAGGVEAAGVRRELSEASRKVAAAELEITRLKELNSSTELHLQATQAQISSLSQRLSDRDSASSPLYAVLACFQRENKTLKEEIHRLQGELVGQESYHALERELKEVEARQSKLEEENKALRRKTEEGDDRRKREDRRLAEIAGNVSDRKREVGQLAEVVRIITHGDSISATLLLGSRLPNPPLPCPDAPMDYLAQETLQLQREIAGLRQLLADVYAEQSGLLCSPQ